MFKCLRNELYKNFRSKKLYVIFSIIVLFQFIMAFGINNIANETGMSGYLDLINLWSFPFQFISQTLSNLFLIMVIVLISGAFSDENNDGTLKLSLIRPITRTEFLFSKIISSIIITAFLLFVSFLTSLLFARIFFSSEGSFFYDMNTVLTIRDGMMRTILYYLFALYPLTGYAMIVLFLSNLFKKTSLTITASLGLLLISDIFTTFFDKAEKFIINSHFYIINYIFKEVDKDFYSSFFIILAYILIFGAFNLIYFLRKDILN